MSDINCCNKEMTIVLNLTYIVTEIWLFRNVDTMNFQSTMLLGQTTKSEFMRNPQ